MSCDQIENKPCATAVRRRGADWRYNGVCSSSTPVALVREGNSAGDAIAAVVEAINDAGGVISDFTISSETGVKNNGKRRSR